MHKFIDESGIYLIIAVKDKENEIKQFLEALLFRIIYGKEEYITQIIVTDLESKDKTKEKIKSVVEKNEQLELLNWDECKNKIESIKL